MSKPVSIIIAILFAIALSAAAMAQTADWSTNAGGQLLIKYAPKSFDLGSGWKSFFQVADFSMPTSGFNQFWGYIGAKKGIFTFDGGVCHNWHGTEPIFLGMMTDILSVIAFGQPKSTA